MNKFKSIGLVKAFPPKEVKFLTEFVRRNSTDQVSSLLRFSLRSYEQGLTDREIWRSVYPETAFNKQQFANYCHQLLKVVEQAICMVGLRSGDLRIYDVLLPMLLEWDLLDHYQFTRAKATRALSKEKTYEYASFYRHRWDYLQFILLEKESSRKADLNINQASDSLDEYYMLLKLRYLCAAESHQRISSAEYDIGFMDALLPALDRSKLADHPMIKNYLLVYQLLIRQDGDENFQLLKEQLSRDRTLFSDAELNEIYIYPINYCIRQINNGSVAYRHELLNIYRSLPGFDIHSTEIISPWRFRNVVQLSVISGELEWAEYFIEHFSHRLLEEYRENAVNYNTANLRFHQKRYQEVIPLLIHVEYQDINYALICKILLLKTYYEMKEMDAFYSLLESFRLYILRSRDLTSNQRKQYLDLLSILRQLAKKEYAGKKAVEKFKKRIRNREIIADKAWILEKLESL